MKPIGCHTETQNSCRISDCILLIQRNQYYFV